MFSYIILAVSLIGNAWLLWKLHEVKVLKTIVLEPSPKPVQIIKKPEVFWQAPSTVIAPVEQAVIRWREAA